MADTPKDRSNPENAPKDASQHSLVNQVMMLFKHMVGFDLNTILGLGNPEIREAAQKLANTLRKTLPNDHWLYSKWSERIVGALAARLETATDQIKTSKPVADVLEKFSDFIERFMGDFYRKPQGAMARTTEQQAQGAATRPSAAEAETFAKIKEIKNMAERLKNCPDANLTDLRKRLIEEQETLAAAEKLMREGLPAETDTDKKESAKPESVGEKKGVMRLLAEWIERQWKEEVGLLHDANAKAETKLNAWKAAAKERQAGKDEWQPNWFGKLLASPWNLLWKLLTGFGGRRKPSRKLTPAQKWEDWCRS